MASLTEKIDFVLTETRVVLPGAQTLLGFQFVVVFSEKFTSLPTTSQYIHLISLILVMFCIMFLMAPAAYHQIIDSGDESNSFHRYASRMLLAAMGTLALGMTGDFFIIYLFLSQSLTASLVAAGAMIFLFYSLWFGFTLFKRNAN